MDSSRSIARGVLQFLALVIWLAGAYWLAAWAQGVVGPGRATFAFPLMAAGAALQVFWSSRAWVRRGVTQLVYGRTQSPNRMLMLLGQRLEAAFEPDVVLPVVVQTIVQTLPVPYAAIALKRLDTGHLELAAQHRRLDDSDESPKYRLYNTGAAGLPADRRQAASLIFPILYQSEQVGELIVTPRDDRGLAADDQSLLAKLAERLSVAAHVARLTQDLRQARERLVLAREEERRRLRRNLHDMIGPTLAALNLKAGAVRALIARDPNAAEAQIGELREQIRSVITDIRRVVYDLRPPALDEMGLLPAIREQAAQFSTGDLQVTVEAPDYLPQLPAAVEVAIYCIVMEALTNVDRHARAQRCWIRLAVGERIAVEVLDDGEGLPPELRAGVGITSMRERATELGGSCRVEALPERGTRIMADLPFSLIALANPPGPAALRPELIASDVD